MPDPKNPGKFVSRFNLLTGTDRPFNLARLQAFGTMCTCYVPVEARHEGKHPAQRRSFKGAILGYENASPCYRVWDFVAYNLLFVMKAGIPSVKKLTGPPIVLKTQLFSPLSTMAFSPRGNGRDTNLIPKTSKKFFGCPLDLWWIMWRTSLLW